MRAVFLALAILVSSTASANYVTPELYARYLAEIACTKKADKIACAALRGDKAALEKFCFAGRLNACLVLLGVYDVQ